MSVVQSLCHFCLKEHEDVDPAGRCKDCREAERLKKCIVYVTTEVTVEVWGEIHMGDCRGHTDQEIIDAARDKLHPDIRWHWPDLSPEPDVSEIDAADYSLELDE